MTCSILETYRHDQRPMSVPFDYDVFLSHSAKDQAVVRDVAERLREILSPRLDDAHQRLPGAIPLHQQVA
jgi:hypothetical protein